MFQSLFFWIHFYNDQSRIERGRLSRCFNPCFSGFTSTTLRHPTPRLLPILFQSLFFWIHFYNIDPLCRGVIDSIVFQSLFFWIHFYNDEDKIRRTNTYLAFQSLFFWIHFYNPGIALPELYQVNVSILVFLDSLLQRIPLVSSLPPDLRFNPCFSGFTSTNTSGRSMSR